MRGVCIDPGGSTTLQEGREYYLFDHGPNYYVSKFDSEKAHFGSYRKSLFELIPEQQQEPQYFIGEVAYPRMGWRVGDKFIIGPTKHPELEGKNYYNVHLLHNGSIVATMNDARLFKEIEPCELPQKPAKIEQKEPESTNALASSEKAENEAESKPQLNITGVWIKKDKPEKKKPKELTKAEQLEAEGQLNLFDFLEG